LGVVGLWLGCSFLSPALEKTEGVASSIKGESSTSFALRADSLLESDGSTILFSNVPDSFWLLFAFKK
jgi:hypothetical protein